MTERDDFAESKGLPKLGGLLPLYEVSAWEQALAKEIVAALDVPRGKYECSLDAVHTTIRVMVEAGCHDPAAIKNYFYQNMQGAKP